MSIPVSHLMTHLMYNISSHAYKFLISSYFQNNLKIKITTENKILHYTFCLKGLVADFTLDIQPHLVNRFEARLYTIATKGVEKWQRLT